VTTAALVLLAAIMILRPCIPPAPLSLVRAEFGEGVSQLKVVSPMTNLPPRPIPRLAALTAIHAPLGLKEKVRHRWYLDGRLIYSSPFYPVTGGRRQGYRIWTQVSWREEFNRGVLTLDVETRGGQLIGRATLRRAPGI
jgi:hypothetical protein